MTKRRNRVGRAAACSGPSGLQADGSTRAEAHTQPGLAGGSRETKTAAARCSGAASSVGKGRECPVRTHVHSPGPGRAKRVCPGGRGQKHVSTRAAEAAGSPNHPLGRLQTQLAAPEDVLTGRLLGKSRK